MHLHTHIRRRTCICFVDAVPCMVQLTQRPSQLLYICNGIFAILERKNNMATQGSHLRCSTGEEASRAASVCANHMSAAASSGPGHAHDTPIEN